ncbi:MAG: carbonic anhydrase [Bacteroidales bacterium]|nr:MAG: carbonic anhydrase [Bacteroidales bacterium]
MNRLVKISKASDIFQEYRKTPVGLLLEYHNLNRSLDKYENAQLLIGMCMDNRKNLRIPDNFAFIIRTGGANLRYNEFKISYAIAIGHISHIVLIGHNNCGMVNLISRKDQFVKGLIEMTDWDKDQAEDHFMHFAPMFEIGDEVDFILNESKRLRLRYPKIQIVPMMYIVDDNQLYLIKEE